MLDMGPKIFGSQKQKTTVGSSSEPRPRADPFNCVPYPFTAILRGKQVYFSMDVINKYLGNPLTLEDGELCKYAKRLARGDWNFELVKDNFMLPGRTYETNALGCPTKFFRRDPKLMLKY
ncbi:hypothetical protein RYX36_004508 [Vicia faba]